MRLDGAICRCSRIGLFDGVLRDDLVDAHHLRLADAVRALSYDEAKALWQCSDALAELNFERFRTLEVRSGALTPAVLAYEGIQYQNLAPQVMTMEQLDYLQEHLRILSGLYGVVRPLDGVAPYRLEMQAKLAVDGARNLYEFWGDSLSRVLAAETDVIVNLASVEYAKAVVPSADRCGARVLTCLFGTVDARDRLVQRSTAESRARCHGALVRRERYRTASRPASLRCARLRVRSRSVDRRLLYIRSEIAMHNLK